MKFGMGVAVGVEPRVYKTAYWREAVWVGGKHDWMNSTEDKKKKERKKKKKKKKEKAEVQF